MKRAAVRLVECGAEDSALVFDIRRSAFREYVEDAGGWDEDRQRAIHDERFLAQRFRLVEVEGAVVGYVASVADYSIYQLHQLMVLPAHQGLGVGTEVLNIVVSEADELAVPVRLRVRMNNPRARALYERIGFVHVSDTPTHWVLERGPCVRAG